MIATFSVLLIFQCLGEALVFMLGLPVPGPVAGMLLLFFVLLWSPRLLAMLEATSNELLRHLALLFVPAGVGIMVSASSLDGHWIAVVCSVLVSTVLTLAVTAATMKLVLSVRAQQRQARSKS